jgi:hypothetical protein
MDHRGTIGTAETTTTTTTDTDQIAMAGIDTTIDDATTTEITIAIIIDDGKAIVPAKALELLPYHPLNNGNNKVDQLHQDVAVSSSVINGPA